MRPVTFSPMLKSVGWMMTDTLYCFILLLNVVAHDIEVSGCARRPGSTGEYAVDADEKQRRDRVNALLDAIDKLGSEDLSDLNPDERGRLNERIMELKIALARCFPWVADA